MAVKKVAARLLLGGVLLAGMAHRRLRLRHPLVGRVRIKLGLLLAQS